MKVSVVIATYNRAQLIRKSIESVLFQTHQDLELIIVNDGSTDNTKHVISEYKKKDERVRCVALEQNLGATTARNRGIEEAQGELIMVWDSDDELYLHALTSVVEIFSRHPEVGIVSSPCRQLLKDGSEKSYRSIPEGEIEVSQIVCKYLPDNEKVRIARAEIFKQVRYEARNIDFIVNGYLASLGKWYHLNEELGVLHLELDAVSLTSNRKRPNAQRSMERVEPLLRYFAQFGELVQTHCPKRYAALSYGLGVGLLLRGDRVVAGTYATAAVRHSPLFRFRALLWVTRIPGGGKLLRAVIHARRWLQW